jgi:hypothetical protein
MKRGFTLIELLIVVRSSPSWLLCRAELLEAQTRSRVARVQADQRTIAVAIESYYVDCSSYPPRLRPSRRRPLRRQRHPELPDGLTASCRLYADVHPQA